MNADGIDEEYPFRIGRKSNAASNYFSGNIAEIIIFGSKEVTQGSQNDLQNVYFWANQMVTKFGFSDLGPIAFNSDRESIFFVIFPSFSFNQASSFLSASSCDIAFLSTPI